MQKFRSFMSFMYLLVFTVTFVPLVLLHTHEADEHRLALVTHRVDHRCTLDQNFCKAEVPGACGHDHHVGLPSEKCFTCQFHFEKNYTSAVAASSDLLPFHCNTFDDHGTVDPVQPAFQLNNKGPPAHC